MVYLRPQPTMYIVQGHPNVDPSGMVYMPYLVRWCLYPTPAAHMSLLMVSLQAEWQAQTSNIPNLIACMSGVFSDKPPLRLRTAADPPAAAAGAGGWGSSPAPAPAPAVVRAPVPSSTKPAPPKTERERRADLVRELTPLLQGQLQEMLTAVRK